MHHSLERPVAARATVIEIAGQKLGVVFPAGAKYRFVAVKLPVFSIDGREFDSIEDARLAAEAAVGAPESFSPVLPLNASSY